MAATHVIDLHAPRRPRTGSERAREVGLWALTLLFVLVALALWARVTLLAA